jgi:2-dehydro-3-deoxygluconokinase
VADDLAHPAGGGLLTLGETMASLSAPGIGPLRHQRSLDLHIGGAESNVAVGVVRLGGCATWVGRVGDDELGDLVLAQLRGEGVDVSHAVRDPSARTGLMIKSRRTPTVGRVTYYRSGSAGSRLAPDDLPLDAVRAAGVLHVTGITPALGESARAATFAAVEEARAAGVLVSLDVNHRSALWTAREATPVLRRLAAEVDILFAGEDEVALLGIDVGAGRDPAADPGAAIRAMVGLGPRQAILKRGARGAVAQVEDRTVEVPAHAVQAVDPVGAGDAFVAGYLAELLAGADADRRLATAAACGAFAVTVPGDWEGLPGRRDLPLLAAASGTVVR